MNTSQIEVMRQTVNNYLEKIQRKNHLMSFAGILDETEADIMLNSIQDSKRRVDRATLPFRSTHPSTSIK